MKIEFKHTTCYRRFMLAVIFPYIAVVMILAGCGLTGKVEVQEPRRYVLYYTIMDMAPQNSKRPYPYILQAGPFEVQRVYNDENIVFKYSPHEIHYYKLDRWAIRPEDMINELVLKHLESVNITNRVSSPIRLEGRPDYRLEGTVQALEKFDAGDVYYAHLSITYRLLDGQGVQLWEKRFDERERLVQEDNVYTVESLSVLLGNTMNTVVASMDSIFLERYNSEMSSDDSSQDQSFTDTQSERPEASESPGTENNISQPSDQTNETTDTGQSEESDQQYEIIPER